MSNILPEGAYVIDNGKFSLTEKFEKYARDQGLTLESIRSLQAELEQFYGPGKKLSALEPYMKQTIERKVGEAMVQLRNASKAFQGVQNPISEERQTQNTVKPPNPQGPTSLNVLHRAIAGTPTGKTVIGAFDPMRGRTDI